MLLPNCGSSVFDHDDLDTVGCFNVAELHFVSENNS